MPKSGQITASGADPTLAAAAVKTVVPSLTLGATVAAVLAASEEALVCVVDLTARTIKAFKGSGATSASTVVEAATPINALTPENPVRLTPWVPSDPSSNVGPAILEQTKSPYSVGSLLNKIEDLRDGNVKFAVVDQLTGKVSLFTTAPTISATPDETFAQDIVTPSATVKLAFE